jgi:uncharacterized protein (TIGR03382 family)
MTAGTFGGGQYGGEYYASSNTNGDPNFTGTSWNATPASAAATAIPNLAGWYTGDPPSIDNQSELLASAVAGGTRANSNLVATAGTWAAPANSNAATSGAWCAHLVVAGTNKVIGVDFTFKASASIKEASGATTQATYQFVPAPGAAALLGVSTLLTSRRRRA